MTVITLSRQWGSHGDEIAAMLAQSLDLRLVDAEAINRAALQAGVPENALAELEHEGERGLAHQVLKALRTMPTLTPTAEPNRSIPFSGLFSPTLPPLSASLEGYVHMVGWVIRGLAREGNVLIMGRGGQVLLKDMPSTLHVQIVATFQDRVQEIMDRQGLKRRTAQAQVRSSDRSRLDYVRRYHGENWLDPTLYDVTLNTSRISIQSAVELVIATQRAKGHKKD